MALPPNLDTDLNFLNEDGSVRRISFEDLSLYWHQSQQDDLSAGVTAEEVKKFFDFFPARVFLPWLLTLTDKANTANKSIEDTNKSVGGLSGSIEKLGESDAEQAKTMDALDQKIGILFALLNEFVFPWEGELKIALATNLMRKANELGVDETQRFFIVMKTTGEVYYASPQEVLAHLSGTELEPIFRSGGGTTYQIGDGLKLDAATNTLSVDTAEAVEADNTKPITSAAVHVTV
ncbi:MAG: hypothetical protein IJ043_03245, partial [Clostridia bacterium]|nr:hypothetical protein [Clostridia bacterium]